MPKRSERLEVPHCRPLDAVTASILGLLLLLGGCTQQEAEQPAFTFVFSNLTLQLQQGGTGRVTATVNGGSGFDGLVTFSTDPLPVGLSGTWLPNPTGGQTEFIVTAGNGAPIGLHYVEVTAQSGETTRRRMLGIEVAAMPTGSIRFSVRGLPAGATADVLVTGPDGFSKSLVESSDLTGLKPGTYDIAAEPVEVDGDDYLAHLSESTITVSAEEESSVEVSYGRAAAASGLDAPVFAGVAIPAGATSYFRVTANRSLANSGDLLLFDVDVDDDRTGDSESSIELTVRDEAFSPVAHSDRRDIFRAASGPTNLGSIGSSEVRTMSFLAMHCFGVCVLEPADAMVRWLEVANTSDTEVTLGIYAGPQDYGDDGEPQNDRLSTAPAVGQGGTVTAAIEVLGDVDYYRISGNGTLYFDSPSQLELRADVFNGDGSLQTSLQPSQASIVQSGDYLTVAEVDGRAAASAESLYFLELASGP